MEPPRRTIRRRHTLGDRPKSQPSLSKRDQKNLAPAAKDWREAAYSLGILKTGYLETASEQWDRSAAATSSVKKTRFVVLTHAQLSWFKRNPGDTEYGDERGAIPLDQVTSVKLDGEKIEVFDQGGLRRWFLCRDGKAKAWRDAIDVARQARCRSPAASSPREAPSALIIRTRQYAKSIVEQRAAYGAATLVEPAAPGSEAARNGCLRHKRIAHLRAAREIDAAIASQWTRSIDAPRRIGATPSSWFPDALRRHRRHRRDDARGSRQTTQKQRKNNTKPTQARASRSCEKVETSRSTLRR